MDGIFSTEFEIVFSPVTRHTAGTYTCTAENPLGMSKPAFVDVDVKCKYIMQIFQKMQYPVLYSFHVKQYYS